MSTITNPVGVNVDSTTQSELTSTVVHPILLAELYFDNDQVFAWNGYDTFTWNGNDYTGVGWLGSISAVQETTTLEVTGLTFTLSGIPSTLLSTALSQDYHNRIARVRRAFLDGQGTDSSNLVGSPYVLAEGLMDTMTIRESGEESTITVVAEPRTAPLERPIKFLWSDQDQRSEYANDDGFEFVAGLQDKQIMWGVNVGDLNAPRVVKPPRR